jgi:aquaporin Z
MYQKFFAEFIGTCVLVLMGCGSAVIAGKMAQAGAPAGIGILGIAIAFGIAVLIMSYTIGPISGCHINPAVTVSMLVAGKIKILDSITYIFAQFSGATAGAIILYLLVMGEPAGMSGEWGLGANGWGAGYLGEYSTLAAFTGEVVFSFLFLFVIHAVTSTKDNSNMAGVVIGLSLVLIHLVSIPITGTSVNPARSFGPAILDGGKALRQLWLFMIAPVAGGVLAALYWKMVFEKR